MRHEDPREEELRSGLRHIRPPDEADALERAIALSAAEHAEVRGSRVRRGSARRLAAAAIATASVLVLALTPAGAAVRDWVGNAVDGGSDQGVRPALTHVPSGGDLLVHAGSSQFSVAEDGSTKLLGDYRQVAWSPHGVFVAAAVGSRLEAIEPDGDLRWRVVAPGTVSDPTWAPGCCRVGYRSDGDLWAVNGDGTLPRPLAHGIDPVPPVWRPAPYDIETQTSPNVLAYVDGRDRVRSVDVDDGTRSAPAELAEQPLSIEWLDRQRIIAVEQHGLEIVDSAEGSVSEVPVRLQGRRIKAAAVAPDGRSVAVLTESGGSADGSRVRSVLQLRKLAPDGTVESRRNLFSGLGHYDGPIFSPDGSRIELGWREADQWRFISPRRGVDPIPNGDITRQFDPAGHGDALPRIEGWCCG